MDKNVKIVNSKNEVSDIAVPYEDVAAIAVNVWDGDEILTIFTKNGRVRQFDAAGWHYCRRNASEGGCYVIYPEDFEEWDKRTNANPWGKGGWNDCGK